MWNDDNCRWKFEKRMKSWELISLKSCGESKWWRLLLLLPQFIIIQGRLLWKKFSLSSHSFMLKYLFSFCCYCDSSIERRNSQQQEEEKELFFLPLRLLFRPYTCIHHHTTIIIIILRREMLAFLSPFQTRISLASFPFIILPEF